MSVFVSGTRYYKYFRRDKGWELPYKVKECLDGLIGNQEEILIGDGLGIDQLVQEYLAYRKYDKVTVYVSGGKGRTKNNTGKWNEKNIQSQGRTGFSFRAEKYFSMAEAADYGLYIWDGKSEGIFISILYQLVLGKHPKTYLIYEDKWISITSVSDLKTYAGMKVDEASLSVIETVCKARISIDRKLDWMQRYQRKRNMKYECFESVINNLYNGVSTKKIKKDIRAIIDYRVKNSNWTYMFDYYWKMYYAKSELVDAIGDLVSDRTLKLYSLEYYEYNMTAKAIPCGEFDTLVGVKEYIRRDKDYDYYLLELRYDYDIYNNLPRYDYYIYNGDICWYEDKSEKACG